MAKSGIKREDIIAWGGPEVFNQGLAIVNAGDVLHVNYDPATRTVSGRIDQPNGWEMPVSFTLLEGGGIRSKCPCYANQKLGQVCSHITAVAIALSVTEMDDVPDPPPRRTSTGVAENQEDEQEEADFIEVPMQPKFGAFVMGSRASLSIEVDAYYGDIDIPACSFQPPNVVSIPDPDDPLVRRVRSLKAEKAAVALLSKMGFEPGYREGDLKYYITSPQKVLNFLGKGYPELRRCGWQVDLAPKLSQLYDSFVSIVPVVSIRDAGNDFYVGYEFDAQGTDISPVEIQAAVNRGDGYLLHDEKVYLFDAAAVGRMHDVFRDCAASQGDAPPGFFRVKGIYAPYVKSSLDTMCDSVELEDEGAQHWRSVSAQTGDPAAKYEPVSLGSLDGILRPYQKQGVYWMRFLENAGHCGLLADEMGLGKTLQTLTWLSLPRSERTSAPSLIVCPTSLVMNWAAEAAKFIPTMKVLVISGPDRAADFSRIPAADLVVTSYALLQRDFDTAYAGREFSALVIDEAQHIKNRQTKNALAVKSVNARRRLALTGTPIENSVADAWSIFDFLMPDYLGDYETFKADFEDPIASRGEGDDESPALALDALDRLKRKIQPFIMRRVKKSVAKDLPDKIVKVSRCPMSEDFQREYNAALAKTRSAARDAVRDRGFAKARFEILAMLMKLRQIASRAKLDSCLEVLVSAIEGGHKILVFSQFVKMLALLREELAKRGIRHCYLDGSTKDRLGECNRFNRSPDIPVFLISLMAGGTGLNLTGADMVMHYDPWWNPAVEDQATDRAHRIGQKKTVYVMKMIAAGSIEEKVLAMQRRKQAIIAATVDTTDAAVMEKLTAADLNELLA